jgi:hypothetical protein
VIERLICYLGAATTCLCLLGTASFGGQPYSIRAHWVTDSPSLEPIVGDFVFSEVVAAASGAILVAGDKFLLRSSADGLRLTFMNDYAMSGETIASEPDGTEWAGGCHYSGRRFRTREGVLWRRDGGEWARADVGSLSLGDWCVWRIRFAGTGEGYALVWRYGPEIGLVRDTIESLLLSFDGSRWSVERPHVWAPPRKLVRLCWGPSGEWWSVGWTAEPRRKYWRPLALVRREGQWQEVATSEGMGDAYRLVDVSCLPEGGIAAVDRHQSVLYRYRENTGWQRLPFPESLNGYIPDAVAAPATDDIWVAAGRLPDEPYLFLRWLRGEWHIVDGPTLPQGRKGGYGVNAMDFVSPDEGWAVAHDGGGPGVVRGLILHYKDGVWRNRNWNWHFWHQRWFGLFGH